MGQIAKPLLERVVQELSKHDLSWNSMNPFSSFVYKALAIFPPDERFELQKQMELFKKRWDIGFEEAERLVWEQRTINRGKKLIIIRRYESVEGSGEWDNIVQKPVNWQGMEEDFKNLISFIWIKINEILQREGIDFEKRLQPHEY